MPISGKSTLFILLFAQLAEVVWLRDDAPQRFELDAKVQKFTNYPFYDNPDGHPKKYLRFPDVLKSVLILSKISAFPLPSEMRNRLRSMNVTTGILLLNDGAKTEKRVSFFDQLASVMPKKMQCDNVADLVKPRGKPLYRKMTEPSKLPLKNGNTSDIDQQKLLKEYVETKELPKNDLKRFIDSLKLEFKDNGMQIINIQRNKIITELEKQKFQAVVSENLPNLEKNKIEDIISIKRSTRKRREVYNNQNQPQMWNYHLDMPRYNPLIQAQSIVTEPPRPAEKHFADLLTKNKFLTPAPLECIACNNQYPPKGFFSAEPTRPPGLFGFNNMDDSSIVNDFGSPRPPTTQPPVVFDVDLSEHPTWSNAFNKRNQLFGKYLEKPKPEYKLPMPTPMFWNNGILNNVNNNGSFGQNYESSYSYLAPFNGKHISDSKLTRGDSLNQKSQLWPSQPYAQKPEQQLQTQTYQRGTAYLQKQPQSQKSATPMQAEILQKTPNVQNAAAEFQISVSETTLSQAPQISGIPIKANIMGLSPSMPQVALTTAIGRFDTDIGRYDDGSSRNTHRFVIPINFLKDLDFNVPPPTPTLRSTRPSPWGSNTGMLTNYRPLMEPYGIPFPPNFVSPMKENNEPIYVPTNSRILTDEDSRPPVKPASNTIILTRDGPTDVEPARDILSTTPETTTSYQSYPDFRQGLFPVPLNQRTKNEKEQPPLNPDREIPNVDNRPEDLNIDRLGLQGHYGGGSNRYKQDNGKLFESSFRKDINDQSQWPLAVDDRRRNSFYDSSLKHGPASVSIYNRPLPPYGGTSHVSGNPNAYKEGVDLTQSEPTHSRLDYGSLVAKEYTTAFPWNIETTTVITVPQISIDERLMYPADRDGENVLARTREALFEASLRIPQKGQVRPYFGPEEITRSRYINENPIGTNIRDGTGKNRFVMIDLPNTSTIS